LEKLKSHNGDITIFEWSLCHIDILENLKVIMVITSYLSDLSTIIEWSRYHIRVISVLKSGLNTIWVV